MVKVVRRAGSDHMLRPWTIPTGGVTVGVVAMIVGLVVYPHVVLFGGVATIVVGSLGCLVAGQSCVTHVAKAGRTVGVVAGLGLAYVALVLFNHLLSHGVPGLGYDGALVSGVALALAGWFGVVNRGRNSEG
jgi:hypothetical protein